MLLMGRHYPVFLPVMSTVELPDDQKMLTGHSTGMSLREILQRIESQLEAKELSAEAASRAAGKPDAIRNLRRAVKDGARSGISTDTLIALGDVLGVAPSWLLEGTGRRSQVAQIPLLDKVTAGKPKVPLSQVADVPLLAFADLGRGDFFALTVEGDSMDRVSPDGSTIVVNQADRTLVAGRAYVISHKGEATFKMWRPDPPRFSPYSTNPVHEPLFVKSKAEAEKVVVGRVKRTVLDL